MGALRMKELGHRCLAVTSPGSLTSTPQPVTCDPLHVCSTKVLPQEGKYHVHSGFLLGIPWFLPTECSVPCGKAAAVRQMATEGVDLEGFLLSGVSKLGTTGHTLHRQRQSGGYYGSTVGRLGTVLHGVGWLK